MEVAAGHALRATNEGGRVPSRVCPSSSGRNNAVLGVDCDVSQILSGEASEFDLLEVAGAHLPRESVGHVLRQTVPETRPSSADRKAKNLDRTLRCPYRKEFCL